MAAEYDEIVVHVERYHTPAILRQCEEVCAMLEALMDRDNSPSAVLPGLLAALAELTLQRMAEGSGGN